MQTATWSHFSVDTGRFALEIPPLNTCSINRYPNSAYLQCLSFKVTPLTTVLPYGKTDPDSIGYKSAKKGGRRAKRVTSATSAERLRAYRQESKENRFGKYYIDVSIQSMSNRQKRGQKLVTTYRASNSQYNIHDYIDEINTKIKINSTNYYNYTPFFIEWVPNETLNQNIPVSVNDYLENFEHAYDLTTRGEYDTMDVPPGANKYKLPADADITSYILRMWISPHTVITWNGELGLKKLGFNEKDAAHTKVTYAKDKRNGTKVFYIVNAHNYDYKTYDAIKSPSQLVLGPNNKCLIRLLIDINLEETFELITMPPRGKDIEEVHSALQDTIVDIGDKINFPMFMSSLEEPPSSASPYLLRFMATNKLDYVLTLSDSLTNAANIYNASITTENPIWVTETYPPSDGTDPPPNRDDDDEYVEESILDPEITLPPTDTDRESGGIVDRPGNDDDEETGEEEEEETDNQDGGRKGQDGNGDEDGGEEGEEEEESEDDEEAAKIAEEEAAREAEKERKRIKEEREEAERIAEEEAAREAERKRIEEEEAAAEEEEEEEEEAAAEEEEEEEEDAQDPPNDAIDPNTVIGSGGSKRKNQDGDGGNDEKKIKTDPAPTDGTGTGTSSAGTASGNEGGGGSGSGSGNGSGSGGKAGKPSSQVPAQPPSNQPSGASNAPSSWKKKPKDEPIYVKYPVTGVEKISMIVQQVGYLYVCVDELYDPFFPGKLFFVLKPRQDSWELMDSYHMQQPFILVKDELEKLNENPITLSVYYRFYTGSFELFSQFSNNFEGLFYWRTE